MKNTTALARVVLVHLIAACAAFLSAARAEDPAGLNLYVALNGNDGWSGLLSSPNAAKSDGPLASLEKAQEKVREMIRGNRIPEGGLRIYLRGGKFPLGQTFHLTAQDSGAPGKPIVWGAYPGETVRLVGGTVLTAFTKVSDADVLKRLPPEARDKIVQSDLKAQGITHYGVIAKPTKDSRRLNLGMELFFNDKPMTLARWPNAGYVKIKDVPQEGDLKYAGDINFTRDGIPVGRHYGRFVYDDPRPAQWQNRDDLYMHGFFQWDWSDAHKRIAKLDTAKQEIHPEISIESYGYHKRQRYYYYNILEELDAPGEYYIDREKGVLYFYPPASLDGSIAYVSSLEEPGILLQDTCHIRLENLCLEGLLGHGIVIERGANNLIAGCTIRNIAGIAVFIENTDQVNTRNGVLSCNIFDVKMGVRLTGGNKKTLEPGGNFVRNCNIHHFGRIVKTYTPAAEIVGVGNILSHNHIHHSPHQGVQITGNENVLEYNEVDHLALETGDVGGFYAYCGWCNRGNKYMFNYFHDLLGPGDQGVNAMYCDDFTSGQYIYGNIFVNAGHDVYIGGGRDNHIENNVFINGGPSVFINGQGRSWAYRSFQGKTWLEKELDTFNFRHPPYSVKYPELLTLYSDEPSLPKYNKIIRNVSYGGRFLDLYDGIDIAITTIENNLIADPVVLKWQKSLAERSKRKFTFYENGNPEVQAILAKGGNRIVTENPIEDIERGKFNPKEGSPAYEMGFKKIPIEKIGLYRDEYRKELPQ